MRKPAASLFISVALTLYLPAPAQARQSNAWGELGGSASGGGVSNTPWPSEDVKMAVGPDGYPILSWWESTDSGFNVFLRRWDGNAWIELGGSGSGSGLSGDGYHFAFVPTVTVDSAGLIYVSYQKASAGKWNIHVIHWNGSEWEPLAGPGPEGGINNFPGSGFNQHLVVDAFDVPWIVWHEPVNSKDEVFLRRWNGTSWIGLGNSATDGGISNTPQAHSSDAKLAFDPAGNPCVAWSEGRLPVGSGSDVYLRRWNGVDWVEIGNSASGSGISGPSINTFSAKDLVVDSTGLPSVLYEIGTGRHEVYLRRWNGVSWAELGGSASGFGISGSRKNGPEELDTIACGVVVDGADHPIVAWTEGDENTPFQVRIRRWTGTAWEGIDGSDNDQGMGATSGKNIALAALAVAPSGDLFIAWDNGTSGEEEIYLRQWSNVRAGDLSQFNVVGPTLIPVGGESSGGSIQVSATVWRAFSSQPIRLQVELRPPGQAFTGQYTFQSSYFPAPGKATLTLKNLVLGEWRWRARAVEFTGYVSPWIEFGGNPEEAVDFRTVAADPVEEQATGPKHASGGKCGLLGIEAPILVALMAGWRHRSRRRRGSCPR